jgi:hypothetical protein
MKNRIVIFITILIIVLLALLQLIMPEINLQPLVERVFYWFFFFFLVGSLIFWKFKGRHLLFIAFGLTVVSAILNILNFSIFSENVIKFSYLFWFVGVFKSMFEYRDSKIS